MDDNPQVQEANDIVTNKENPKYKLFYANDPDTKAYVDALWAKAHPGTQEIGTENTGGVLARQMAGAVADHDARVGNHDSEVGAELTPQQQATAAELQENLRRDPEFGPAYEQNMARAQAVHAKLFGDRAEEIAAQVDDMLTEAEKIQAIKLLAKLGG